MKQLPFSKLQSLFAAVSADRKLYIPADDAAGQASFTVWQEGIALTKKLNTVRSAKDLFFPQVENLVGFRVTGRQLDLVETRDPSRRSSCSACGACDARSFEILDRVFLSEPQDTYYAARRAHGTVVTLACTRPEETCFCPALQHRSCGPAGRYQLLDRGRNALLAGQHGKGRGADRKPSHAGGYGRRQPRPSRKKRVRFSKSSRWPGSICPPWARQNESALRPPGMEAAVRKLPRLRHGTFVCPTASAMISRNSTPAGSSAASAAGTAVCTRFHEDVRRSAAPDAARALPAALHAQKLVYFPDNNDGCFGCVGCGRCLAKCPIHMNIVKVIKTLGEEHA